MKLFLSYIVYFFVWLISFMPFWMLYIISDLNYLILSYLIRYRRSVINTNLKNSFPNKTDKERSKIRRAYYHHLCDYFIETIKVLHMGKKSMMKRCHVVNIDEIARFTKEGRSVACIMGHYCNWEWVGSYPLWDSIPQFTPIYKPLHNKVMDKLFINIRSRFGAFPVEKKKVLRSIINNKRAGIVSVMGFVGDQTPTRKNIRYWTNFLNQDTPVFLGVEKIARKFDMPVFFVKMNKLKRGHYSIELELICESSKDTKEFEITEKHTRILENHIKENPAYWLWSHRRWKHKK